MIDLDALTRSIAALGAHRVGTAVVEDIEFEPDFRKLCESNACGMYGRSWMCPPHVGEVEELIARAESFRWAVVFQTVDPLEDSYDFEGMIAAGERMNRLITAVRRELAAQDISPALLLGAGGCRICPACAKLQKQPCRHPELALASLEAYGINVSLLALLAGMKYVNGPNTVTYFGTVLLGER